MQINTRLKNIFIAGVAGTTGFTLFSILMSHLTVENFNEPKILGKMINRVTPVLEKKQAMLTGWFLHYLVGIGFAAAYKQLIERTGFLPVVKNGIFAGGISGLAAAFVWHTTLKKHPFPPGKKKPSYYLQLIAGHAIFGSIVFKVFGIVQCYKPR